MPKEARAAYLAYRKPQASSSRQNDGEDDNLIDLGEVHLEPGHWLRARLPLLVERRSYYPMINSVAARSRRECW